MKILSMDDRLAKNRFDSDDVNSHIIVDKIACRTCTDNRACTFCCPAERYKWDTINDKLSFDHVGCLECGNCRFVCSRLNKGSEGYSWNYPEQGKGIIYQQG